MKVQFTDLTAFLEELALAVATNQVEGGLVRRTYRYISKYTTMPEYSTMHLVAGYIEIREEGKRVTRRVTELCLECGVLRAGAHERNRRVEDRAAVAMLELVGQVEAWGLTLRGGRFVDAPSD
jgi:hypothetical protein